MDYDALLDLTAELGYQLAMAGAETFRVEDSINRIFSTYGIESEVFAITNCMTISIKTTEGKSVTRMRRIGHHGNDLDTVERYNALSRRICNEKPELSIAKQWLQETYESRIKYKLPVYLLGNVLGAAGFAVFFGGNLIDAACAGVCGLFVGLTDRFLDKFKTNHFFRSIACSFIMALVAYICGILGIARGTDTVIIGALMILVPGLLFTNAMRDIIFGDTNSGINRIVQVLLIAAGIALGTGTAWNLSKLLWGVPVNPPILDHGYIIPCIAAFVGGIGFSIVFNIHGGKLICGFGAGLTWAAYSLGDYLGCSVLMCYFISTLVAAAYSEAMARIRKFPALTYLCIAIFPLIPGAGIYYTTNYLVQNDMTMFAAQGKHTIAIAGVIAVGILMVSTIVRLWGEWKKHKQQKELR